jgi:UTP:GlnB (protein PII) uridylyltransferase
MKKSTAALRRVSPERIREELAKILKAPRSFGRCRIMDSLGIWEIILPETRLLRGLDQGGYHHLDVWGHSLQALAEAERVVRDQAKKLPPELKTYLQEPVGADRPRIWLLKLACLLHDIAKPQTRSIGDDGRVHFYTHEKKGGRIAGEIGRRLKLNRKEVKILQHAVYYHLRAGQLVNRVPSKRAKFRFFRDAGDDAVMILLLALADRRAMRGPLSRAARFTFLEAELFAMIADYFKQRRENRRHSPLLDGHAVMRLLKLPAGPLVGKILRELEEAQAVKAIRSRKEAEKFVCKFGRGLAAENNS